MLPTQETPEMSRMSDQTPTGFSEDTLSEDVDDHVNYGHEFWNELAKTKTREKELSTRLLYILDSLGLSVEIRQKYREYAAFTEVTQAAIARGFRPDGLNGYLRNHTCHYVFGSGYEGTTTYGLHSDFDVVYCNETLPVVSSRSSLPKYGGYVIFTDESTHPGYVKIEPCFDLQHTIVLHLVMGNGTKQDRNGVTCLKHQKFFVGKNDDRTRHGPSDTTPEIPGAFFQIDEVFALRSKIIPELANHWLYRERKYNWPPSDLLKTMGSYGVLLVGVGHPESEDPDIEWRLSFSFQERVLMSSLNQTQHKCYVLLKMIKHDIIQTRVGESITSYHCKTALFYTIEQTQSTFWTEDNLIRATCLCLLRLLRWVMEQCCPNYFIPEENMFDKISKEKLESVILVLLDVLVQPICAFLGLQCDDIGNRLNSHNSLSFITQKFGRPWVSPIWSIYENINYFYTCVSTQPRLFKRFCGILKTMDTYEDYSSGEVRDAISRILPHVYLYKAQKTASRALSRGEHKEVFSSKFHRYIAKGAQCDLISAELLLATCYIRLNMYTEFKTILDKCFERLNDSKCIARLSMCRCGTHSAPLLPPKLFHKPVKEVCAKHITGCILFLPRHANLVHPALQYEMFRSMFTLPGSRDESTDQWFDLIAVDSIIYLCFLDFLKCSHVNGSNEDVQLLISKFKKLIEQEVNLGHRETAWNLLGWMCYTSGLFDDALECFLCSLRMSLRISRPDHNAAKWHLAIMLHELYNSNKFVRSK